MKLCNLYCSTTPTYTNTPAINTKAMTMTKTTNSDSATNTSPNTNFIRLLSDAPATPATSYYYSAATATRNSRTLLDEEHCVATIAFAG